MKTNTLRLPLRLPKARHRKPTVKHSPDHLSEIPGVVFGESRQDWHAHRTIGGQDLVNKAFPSKQQAEAAIRQVNKQLADKHEEALHVVLDAWRAAGSNSYAFPEYVEVEWPVDEPEQPS